MLDNIANKGCKRATVIRAGGLAYIHALEWDGTLYKFGDVHGYCSMEHVWLNGDFNTHEQRKAWAKRWVEEYKAWKAHATAQYESELQAWKQARLNWEIELVLICAKGGLDVFPSGINHSDILAHGEPGIRTDYEAWSVGIAHITQTQAKSKKVLGKHRH